MMRALKVAWKAGGAEFCRRLVEENLDEWKKIPLNVAVIGNSGVGKSTFINAIRRLTADDEGAAAVGVTETTGVTELRSYTHPDNPMLKFWDLPGVGTDEFPKATYLSRIDVDSYDFFLLITAGRYTENDTWLCQEFRERNKKSFFVRTKIGQDLSSDKEAHPRTHDENAVMNKIRESTIKHLEEKGFKKVSVFLIDSHKVKQFQFEELEQQLIKQFADRKREVVVLSLQSTCKRTLDVKVKELRHRIWKMAILSGFIAAVPLPGLSIGVDTGIATGETKFYMQQLGLDAASLQRYANFYKLDYKKLVSIVNDALGVEAVGIDVATWLPLLLPDLLPYATAAQIATRVFLPLTIGGNIAMVYRSYHSTHLALTVILNKFETVATKVDEFAVENLCTAGSLENAGPENESPRKDQ